MPKSRIIAVICDFDDTLGGDTTDLFLREVLGMRHSDIKYFWNVTVWNRIKAGWDPPLAYMSLILSLMRKNEIQISNAELKQLGSKAKLFPGVPEFFSKLRSYISADERFNVAKVSLEYFVVSGGFEEILKGTDVAASVTEDHIFGCTFHESPTRGIYTPKSAMTFTEKTKFIYAINKGVDGEIRRNPSAVNDFIKEDQRRIPLDHMVYIGDGPTDIPAFRNIQSGGGTAIGVLKYNRLAGEIYVDKERAWSITKGKRTDIGPFIPNYTDGESLYENLKLEVEKIALRIHGDYLRRE